MSDDFVTIGARIPKDLKQALYALAALDNFEDLSPIIRQGLRFYADHRAAEVRRAVRQAGTTLFDPAAGGARNTDPATTKLGAVFVAPRSGTARFRALEAFEAAGDAGLITDDVVRALHPAPQNSTAKRVSELKAAGAIAVRMIDGGAFDTPPVEEVRPSRYGVHQSVYRITVDGRAMLAAGRRKHLEEATAA